MQFKAFESGIEVNAPTVSAIVQGLGCFTNISRRYLNQVGIGTVVNKKLILDMDAWYSQEAWLEAFENIARQIGDRVLFNIGMSIPSSARFPSRMKDIHDGIRSIDVAYHLNHRKNGKSMFDTRTNTMIEGIGHYGYEPVEGENEIVCVCNNPYPCAFDKGIITAMTQRFKPEAYVIHDDSQECRKNGFDSCTYRVLW